EGFSRGEQRHPGQRHGNYRQKAKQRERQKASIEYSLIKRVDAQKKGDQEGDLAMPGQRRKPQRRAAADCPSNFRVAAFGQDCTAQPNKGQGEPRGDSDQIQVADMGDKDIGEHESQSAEDSRRSPEWISRLQETQASVPGAT